MLRKDKQYLNVTNIRICMNLPPELNSNSMWAYHNQTWLILKSALPTVQLQISLIYFGTLAFHIFLSRLGIPRFTSMTISGLIFATTFNKTWDEKMKLIFSIDSQGNLGLISVFGYILFLFYIGVKTDMSMVFKTGRCAFIIGTIAILAPFLVGMIIQHLFSSNVFNLDQKRKLPLIVGMLSFSSFPVISSVLSELNILNSELGRLGLSSAIISDMFSFFMTSIITFSTIMMQHPLRAFIDIGATLLFILIVVFVLRKAMFQIIKQTPEGYHVNDHYIYAILVLALFLAYTSHQFDLFALFGPYVLGLAIPEGPPLGTAIINKIDTFVNGIFMPTFVTVCVMRVDLKNFMNWTNEHDGKLDMFMVQCVVLVVVTFVAKFVFCMLPSLHSKMPLKDATSLSLIMSCKGVVEMATYSFFRDIMGLPDNVFALLMICMILNATTIPMLLRRLYDPTRKYAGYIKRNIIDLNLNSELRVLSCIYRPDNIPSVINLLEATYPTREKPLNVYVLHLIELIGRSYPIFISHQLQKNTNDQGSFSNENLHDTFKNFAEEFKGHLTVNTFTAVSPAEMMHDDICQLALNKLTSLIILPFHQKWSSDGNCIELDDKSLRDLNYSVLERAPCSIGILIEKAQMTHTFSPETPYNVCLMFIGGRDDREALIFAKRMTKNPHVRLSMVRFLALNNEEESDSSLEYWEEMCDTELIENMKKKNAFVKYSENIVKDGPETALIVRSMVNEYDLIIVGRRGGVKSIQTSGLIQWSEFPELGVLGDLLASTDIAGAASIFVMQQQKTTSNLM